jgi:hypothetical protein
MMSPTKRSLVDTTMLVVREVERCGLQDERLDVGADKLRHPASGIEMEVSDTDWYMTSDDFIRNRVNPFLKQIQKWRQGGNGHPEMAGQLDALLAERGKTHGPYSENARISQSIKAVVRGGLGWFGLTEIEREVLDQLALKMARIASGKSLQRQHWEDVVGYGTLVLNTCSEGKDNA